jgi:hypothetical protein
MIGVDAPDAVERVEVRSDRAERVRWRGAGAGIPVAGPEQLGGPGRPTRTTLPTPSGWSCRRPILPWCGEPELCAQRRLIDARREPCDVLARLIDGGLVALHHEQVLVQRPDETWVDVRVLGRDLGDVGEHQQGIGMTRHRCPQDDCGPVISGPGDLDPSVAGTFPSRGPASH